LLLSGIFPKKIDSRMRVEPCEFESLLQRAVEILSEGTKRDRI